MDRLIEVTVTGRHVFSESEIIDAFDLKHPTSIELLDYAEELIRNLDSDMIVDMAHIDRAFLYDYEEKG